MLFCHYIAYLINQFKSAKSKSPVQVNDSYLELKFTNLHFLSAIQISQLCIIAYLKCIAFTIVHCIHNHALPLTRLRLTLFALLLISSALHLHKSDLHWSDLHWEQNPHWWWLLWKISDPLQFFDQSLHQLIIVNCTIISINIGYCDCKYQI